MTDEAQSWYWFVVAALLGAAIGLLALINQPVRDPYTWQESCTDVDGHIVTITDTVGNKHQECRTAATR